MTIGTILLFFICTYCFGFSLTFFIKQQERFLEKTVMRIGIGLCAWVFLLVALGIMGVSLDWRLFLILSLLGPFVYGFMRFKSISIPQFTLKKSDIYAAIAILLCVTTLYVYTKGAFGYPWLEDDDSWNHAVGVKYVAVEKSITGNPPAMYIDPYPPGYDSLLGVLHQTNDSLSWNMKFFNSMFVALSIAFFYFFVLQFSGKRNIALFAAFVLFSFPSYLGHFIWAHTLVVTLFVVALYCIEKVRKDKNWILPTLIAVSSMWLAQPSQPLKFFVLLVFYVAVRWIGERKFNWPMVSSILGGYLLSFGVWWRNHLRGVMPDSLKFGTADGAVTVAASEGKNIIQRLWVYMTRAFPPHSGSATRVYSFDDIVYAQHNNMINNPIGVGVIISLLIAIGALAILLLLLFKFKDTINDKNNWKIIAFIWATLTFMGLNSLTFNLPLGFFGFRFWMLFALMGSIVAAEGVFFVAGFLKDYKLMRLLVITLFVIGVIFTSAHQKHSVSMATWPPGLGWQSYPEVLDYAWLKENLPKNTPVFTFADNSYVLGFDMYICTWCDDINEFRETAINQSAEDIHAWMKSQNLEYLLLDSRTARKYGADEVNAKVNELAESRLFGPVHSANTIVLLRAI